uniref:Uncharacterized protein n=1 Tax=Thermosporothrix sp. COM3 TaxID=2490863 RepID=A0A455SEU5_9CHLR|nr:hypothetical protein KTC_07810 [Thermosporothrix sp. COM3]
MLDIEISFALVPFLTLYYRVEKDSSIVGQGRRWRQREKEASGEGSLPEE